MNPIFEFLSIIAFAVGIIVIINWLVSRFISTKDKCKLCGRKMVQPLESEGLFCMKCKTYDHEVKE